jgi:hypothetical protein
MKKILAFLLVLSCLDGFAQTTPPGNDTSRYIWYRYQYGIRYNRGKFDSVLDGPHDTAYSKAGYAVKSGLFFYWDGTKWNTPGGGTPGSGLTSITGNSPIVANTAGSVVSLSLDTAANHAYAAATQWDLTQREPKITAPFLPGYYYNGYKQMVLLNTDSVPQGTNKYFSNALARGAFSVLAPLIYNAGTGVFSVDTSTGVTHLATQDWVIKHQGSGGSYVADTNYLATRRYVDSLAKPKLSVTTIGTSGPAIYNPVANVLNIPNYATSGGGGTATIPPNRGAGFRIYSPQVPAFNSLFGSYAFSYDSTSNTGGLTGKIDTALLVTKAYFNANVAGGARAKDTAAVYYLGSGLRMFRAASPDSLKSRTEFAGYGIFQDTTQAAGGAVTRYADTSSLHGLASKDRLAAAIAAALSGGGGYTAGYGLRLTGSKFYSDTPRLKLAEAYDLRPNDPTYDNGANINAGLALAKSLHINAELPKDTFYIKTTLLPQSGVQLYGQGRQTVIKGNFTSDHVLMNNPSAVLNDFGLNDIMFDRRGANNSHGTMFANAHRLFLNNVWWFDNDTTAAGGALGVSAFTPWVSYPSDNIYINDCHFIGSGNFSAQFGNADFVFINGMSGFRNYREFLGVEPYSISGEGGRVNHLFANNMHNYNPVGTYPNGSATGVYIVTTSSKGTLSDIHITNAVDSGGTAVNNHGFNILGSNDVYLVDCATYGNGGFALQVTSASLTLSSRVHVSRFKANNNGGNGVTAAAVYVHDAVLSDFDINSENNPYAFVEDGKSKLNTYTGNFVNNTNAYVLNSGQAQSSMVINAAVDSTGTYNLDIPALAVAARTLATGSVATDSIVTAGPTVNGKKTFKIIAPSALGGSGGVIPGNRGGGFRIYSPQVPAFNTLGSTYGILFDTASTGVVNMKVDSASINGLASKTYVTNIFGDTIKSSLNSVMANSSVLKQDYTIFHVGLRYQFFGGTKNPVQFANGIQMNNQGLYGTTQSNMKGSFEWVDSLGSGVGEHLWVRGNRSAPYDLLLKRFNDFRIIDSAGQHIGWQLRYDDGTYANAIYFPYATSSSGGGSTPTWEQTLTAQGSTVFGAAHQVEMGANALVFHGTSSTGQVTFLNGVQMVGFSMAGFRQATANYTAAYLDDKIDCYSQGGSFTINLPTLVTGKIIIIKKQDVGNSITIGVASGNQLNNTTNGTVTLSTQNKYVWVQSSGSGSWDIINAN